MRASRDTQGNTCHAISSLILMIAAKADEIEKAEFSLLELFVQRLTRLSS